MHRLLKRQLDRHARGPDAIPEEWAKFITAVNDAYEQSDVDRNMLERSLELSSRELLQANSELRVVFQALPDVFFRLDRQGRILDHKGATTGDYYLAPQRLHGKQIQDVPVESVAKKFREAIDKVVKEQSLVTVEYSLRVRGRTRDYEARLLPLLTDQIIVLIRNITHRKDAERALAAKAQELSRSNAELEQFAYVASHDLQEPLRTVQSYLQLLERRYRDKLDGDANEFIDYAVHGAKRMRELIDDLLTYARLTSRMRPFEQTDLGPVLADVLKSLDRVISDRGAIVSFDPLPTVMADGRQMGQLFQNLISNALKFRGLDPPHVHVSAEKVDQAWQVSVADNGIGIDPKYAEKIFVIFQRLHSRDEYSGTGIGLALCKKIVEQHHGRIWLKSRPEKGSTFFFTLPAEGDASP